MKKRKNLALCLLLGSLVLTTGLVLSSCQGNNPNENQNDNPGGNPGENPGTDDPGKDPKPEEKTYKVSFAANEEAEMKTDKTEYKKGETVTITLNVKNVDKTVDLVKLSNEGEVTVVTVDKTYTFVMPESDVTVTVTLKDREYGQRALTVNQVEGFAVKFFVNDQEVTSAKKYDEVTVKVESTSTTKRFKSLTSAAISLKEVEKGKEYSFTMIDAEVALVLEAENIPSRNLSVNSGDGFTAQFKVGDQVVTSALEGTTVTLAISIQPDYFFVAVEWTGIAKESVTEVTQGAEYTFTVGLENISVNVDVDPVPTYDIKINEVDGFTTSFTVDGKEISKAKEGQQVKLTVTYDAEFYRFNGVSAKFGDKEITIIPINTESSEGKKVFQFPMPAGQVDITMDAEAIPSHALKLEGENLTTSYFEVNGEKVEEAKEGEEVTLFLEFDHENYIFKGITSENVELEEAYNYQGARSYTFIMGATDVVISVDVERIPDYNLTVNQVVGATARFSVNNVDGVTSAREGQEVAVIIDIEKSYELIDFKINDGTIEYEKAAGGTVAFKFVMPAGDVHVTFDVEQKEKYEIVSIDSYSEYIYEPSIAVGDKYYVGEEVTFTFVFSGDSGVTEELNVSVNDTIYKAEFVSVDPEYNWKKIYSVTFIMPEDDVTIAVYPNQVKVTDGTGFTLNISEGEHYKVMGVENGAQYSNDDFAFVIVPDDGYKVSSFTYTIDGDTENVQSLDLGYEFEVDMTSWGSGWHRDNLIEDVTSTLDINIVVEYVGSYDVVLGNTFGVEIEGRTKKILAGDSVEITPVALEGYQMPDPIVANLTYKDDTGAEKTESKTSSYTYISFDMPKSNVVVNFELDKTYGLSVEENSLVEVKFTNSQSKPNEYAESLDTAVMNDPIWVHCTPQEGYIVTGVEVVGHPEITFSSIETETDYYRCRFSMPEHDVQLRVNVEKMHKLSYDENQISVSISQGYTNIASDELVAGEEYTLEIEPLRGYEIIGKPVLIHVEGEEIKEVTLTAGSVDGEYTFVAPAADLELKVETKELARHTVTYNFSVPGYSGYGSPSLKNDEYETIFSGDQVIEGETLTISSFSPTYESNWDIGYEYDGIYLIYNDGEKLVEEKVDGTSFVVPAYDFEIEIRVNVLDTSSLRFELPEGVSVGSVYLCETNSSYSSNWEYISPDTYGGTDFTLIDGYYAKVTLSSDEADNFKLLDLSTLKVQANGVDVEVTKNNNGENNVEEVEIVFQVSGDTTISIGDLYQAPSSSFTFDEENLPVGISSSYLETRLNDYESGEEIYSDDRVAEGSEVYIVYAPSYSALADYENYEVQLWSSDGTRMLGSYKLTDGSYDDWYGYTYYYYYCSVQAPAEDVLIKIVYNGTAV